MRKKRRSPEATEPEAGEPAAGEVSTEATADVTDSAAEAEPESSATMSESVEAGAAAENGGQIVPESEKQKCSALCKFLRANELCR